MADKKKESTFQSDDINSLEGLHRFTHGAMAAIFEIVIYMPDDETYASQAARAAFRNLDRLEEDLSHFIPYSDISRINRLQPGESATVSLETFDCLQQCQQIYRETGGKFDVTVGALMKCWLGKDRELRKPSEAELTAAKKLCGVDRIKLDEKHYSVSVTGGQVQIDLGGIGKGFGVDKIVEDLKEWDVKNALINGGQSTIYGFGKPANFSGWPVRLSHPDDRTITIGKIQLHNRALAASSLEWGRHIIDPHKGQPLKSNRAAWSLAASATTADALSTAFMIMDIDDIKKLCQKDASLAATVISDHNPKPLQIGNWQPRS